MPFLLPHQFLFNHFIYLLISCLSFDHNTTDWKILWDYLEVRFICAVYVVGTPVCVCARAPPCF